jgi:anion-transporting  ArsA/GET3 family ATPase
MKNQLATLENYSLSDLCKTGGLQDIYDISADSVNEICDLSTTKGRKRQKSLAAQVASSKVLFEKACRGFVQDKKAEIKSVVEPAEKEIRSFVKSMDDLRDKTKQPVLDLERLESDELDAYEMAVQIVADNERAARDALHAQQAMTFAHMEGIIQNMEFDAPNISGVDIAKFHCENKGQVFDLEKFKAKIVIDVLEQSAKDTAPVIVDHIIQHNPSIIAHSTSSSEFAQMAAVEDLLKAVPSINGDQAVMVIKAIKTGLVNCVEFTD